MGNRSFPMQRVLVTGASGFLGRQSVPMLLAAASDVHALVGSRQVPFPPGVQVHRCNLHDGQEVAQLIARLRPTHLLHLAWNTAPGTFWTAPDNLDWLASSLHLVRCFAAQGGRRLVIAGTCAEYQSGPEPLHETRTPCRPSTLYGCCKQALHVALDGYARQEGLSLGWARLFGLFGPFEQPERMVASSLLALLSGQPVRCTSGLQERDFLHVQDAASALVTFLQSGVEGPVNIGSGQAVSIRQLIQTLADTVGGPASIEFGAWPLPCHEPPRVLADVGRLRDELGWTPALTLSAGLADAARWWREERCAGASVS